MLPLEHYRIYKRTLIELKEFKEFEVTNGPVGDPSIRKKVQQEKRVVKLLVTG